MLEPETLDFKFLLRPKYSNAPSVVEEGPNRQLIGGALQGDQRLALFRISSDEVLEYRVFIKADRVSPFDLAASWRAYQENLRPSAVRGIPDVSLGTVPEIGAEVHFHSQFFSSVLLPIYCHWHFICCSCGPAWLRVRFLFCYTYLFKKPFVHFLW